MGRKNNLGFEKNDAPYAVNRLGERIFDHILSIPLVGLKYFEDLFKAGTNSGNRTSFGFLGHLILFKGGTYRCRHSFKVEKIIWPQMLSTPPLKQKITIVCHMGVDFCTLIALGDQQWLISRWPDWLMVYWNCATSNVGRSRASSSNIRHRFTVENSSVIESF